MSVIRDYIESRLSYLQENNVNIHQDTQPWALSDMTQVLLAMVKNNPLAKETVLSISTAIDIAKTGALTPAMKETLLTIPLPLSDMQIREKKIHEICRLFRELVEAHQKEALEVLAHTEKLNASEKKTFLNNSNKSYLLNLLASQGFCLDNSTIQPALVYFLNELHWIYDQPSATLCASFDDNICVSLVNTVFIADEGLSLDSNANIFLSMVGEEKLREYLHRVFSEEQFLAQFGDIDIVDLVADPNFDKDVTIEALMKKLALRNKPVLDPNKSSLTIEKNEQSLKAGLLQALAAEQRKDRSRGKPKNKSEGIINILFNVMTTRRNKKPVNSTPIKQAQYSATALVTNTKANAAAFFERSNLSKVQAPEELHGKKPSHSNKQRS